MKAPSSHTRRPVGMLRGLTCLGILVLFTAAPGKPGCGGSLNTIVAELDDPCHSSNVKCAAGLDCVSYYDGGQMICSAPCQTDAHCPSTQVCNPAAQISDYAAASAPLVCQNHCTDLPGSGCGGEPGEPWTIVKWEVAQVGGLYNLRGINSDGDAYLDATIEWPGDEVLTMTFESPASCEITMNIAEAHVYDNTCDEEAAAVIGSVGLDLFTDLETVLADAKKDASSNWLTKGCPWVVGGMGAVSAGFFSAGALWGASFAAAAGTGMIGAAVTGGAVVALPAIAILGVTAGGCWLNGKLQDPPLSECIADCSYGNTPCFDGCVDDELGAGELENAVLLPQCLFACEQSDDACLDSCSYLLL